LDITTALGRGFLCFNKGVIEGVYIKFMKFVIKGQQILSIRIIF